VDDQRLMFVLKIWVYRHDLNKYLSCDENIIINLITYFAMDYFFWHKTFGTNFFLSIQGCGQNNIKTSKLRHGGTKNFIFGLK
jgi:hypothetical protein